LNESSLLHDGQELAIGLRESSPLFYCRGLAVDLYEVKLNESSLVPIVENSRDASTSLHLCPMVGDFLLVTISPYPCADEDSLLVLLSEDSLSATLVSMVKDLLSVSLSEDLSSSYSCVMVKDSLLVLLSDDSLRPRPCVIVEDLLSFSL
ncbi:32548_t:CDS:2, partial [Racocetra persica]